MTCSHSKAIAHTIILNKDTDEQLECSAYERSICKSLICFLGVILSLGTLLLILYWKPNWKVKCTHWKSFINRADTLIIKAAHSGDITIANVVRTELQDRCASVYAIYDSYPVSPSSSNSDLEEKTLLSLRHKTYIRYFVYQHARYVWDETSMTFKRLRGLDNDITCTALYDLKGLSELEQRQRLALFGENTIQIQVKSYPKLLIEEILNPFYIFQVFSIILWALDDYLYYAVCIFIISAISVFVSLYETRKQRVTLREMVSSHNTSRVIVSRGDFHAFEQIESSNLVPGDVIEIPANGCIMSCDAVLVSGNCIVNESMLTGESVPVTKTPLMVKSSNDEIYLADEYKRHTLFCGTKVIQTRYYDSAKVLAVVVKTGFSTSKGELVRSILFPKAIGFKFYEDSIRFIMVLALVASVGMAYSTFMYIHRHVEAKYIVLRALDIITIVVPPALPAAMTVGVVFAQSRLKKNNIFCISPPKINICGKLKLVCFDKTGTLTEEGLDLWGVVTINGNRFQDAVLDPTLLPRGPFINAMATCHSLTMIGEELTGDPLDLKMFQATKWILEEPGSDTTRFDMLMPTTVHPPYRRTSAEEYFTREDDLFKQDEIPFEIGIVRQFPFSSTLQRMSVITRTLGSKNMDLYAKGSPEQIALLCHANTLPEDFSETLQQYTIQGYRVLALAWRKLDRKLLWRQAQQIKREQVECELEFLGLLIMQNTLKPETTPVINQLRKANIRTVMITGDNILTAISVARDCNMVLPQDQVILIKGFPPEDGRPACLDWEHAELPRTFSSISDIESIVNPQIDAYQTVVIEEVKKSFHFALSGKTFFVLRHYFPNLFYKVLINGTIFGRMAPDQKQQLIEAFQDLGYITAMCGDGANDCGALKAAHTGISLSDAEASVASPFTSKINNIECVPMLIKEGRCSLVTSFGLFKFMALYSIVQFISVLILYEKQTNLGDFMFLYIDLCIITVVAILMGRTGPYNRLVAQPPSGSLISFTNIASIFVQIILVIGAQAGAFLYLMHQHWFIPLTPDRRQKAVLSWEGTVIFGVSCYQYIILAIVFSKGPPYRRPMYTNVLFMMTVCILTAFTSLVFLQPLPYITELLQIKFTNHDHQLVFRLQLIALAFVNFMLSLFLEYFIVDLHFLKRMIKKCRKKISKSKYKRLKNELLEDASWPPIGEILTGSTFDHQKSNEVS